ncbi:MAG: AsnC family transcriptional regulator [Thermodesulfobacteriota bacterium]|nr:AsnC family transcriptional regulator [Thermodesulfobacteriota bacterium]
MDKTDRLLLSKVQSNFPLTARPFQKLAGKMGVSEEEIIYRLKKLKEQGIIRRISANFNSKAIGFISTLCAAHVPQNKVEKFVEAVNEYPGVTHNYERNHHYNVWFTFIAENKETIEKALEEISTRTGVHEILNLPAINQFKIDVSFNLSSNCEND